MQKADPNKDNNDTDNYHSLLIGGSSPLFLVIWIVLRI